MLDLDPDVVVVGFCLSNDFGDSVFWERYRYYKPFARLTDAGKLAIDGYPIPNVKRFPSRYDSGVLGCCTIAPIYSGWPTGIIWASSAGSRTSARRVRPDLPATAISI